MQRHFGFTVISDFTVKGLNFFIFIKASSSTVAQTIQLSEADERRNMFSIKTMLNFERHASPSAAILQLVQCS